LPYIPEKHEKYHLLPMCRNSGGEVFDYPSKLIHDAELIVKPPRGLLPYNFDSYAEYYGYLDELIDTYANAPEIADTLIRLKQRVIDMNQKEEWSVVKYVGPSDDGGLRLTHGMNYYWPTRKDNPVYCGVVDDEEFTSYLYPTDAHLWKILEDPTGMAYRTIFANGKGSMTSEAYAAMMAQFGCIFSDTQE